MPGWVMGMCVRAPAVSNKLHISYVNSARYIEGYMGKVRNHRVRHRVNPSAIKLSCSLWLVGKVSAETFRKVSG